MAENPQFDKVKEFNLAFGHAVRDTPSLDHDDIPMRVINVFLEEALEVVESYLRYLSSSALAAESFKVRDMYVDRHEYTSSKLTKALNDLLLVDDEIFRTLYYEEDLLDEEDREGHREEAHNQMVKFLDGLADTEVVLNGLAQATGMPITEAFDVAHESNMSKLGEDGLPIYYPEDHEKAGKIAKGPNFWEPHEKFEKLILEA